MGRGKGKTKKQSQRAAHGFRTWLPAALWMSVIFATSCTVISSKQLTKAVVTHGPTRMTTQQFSGFWSSWWWLFVKGYHVLEYILLTLLLMKPLRGRLTFVFLAAIAYAASDEYHQTYVPGRGGTWTDVTIDSIGVTLACLGALVVRRLAKRKKV